MKHALTRFREGRSQTLEAFAADLGTTKAMVWKWENGTIPRPEQMRRIIEFSDGAVTANDWYAEAAE